MLRSSASIRQSSAFNQNKVNHCANPVLVVNEEGQITFANPQAQKLVRYSAAQLIGKPMKEACLFGQKESIVRGFCSTAPLEIDGPRQRSVLVIHDLTERTWAEKARKEMQLRLTALLDSAIDGIVSLDDAQRIVMCNAAVETMFGRTAGELVGNPVECILPGGVPPSPPASQPGEGSTSAPRRTAPLGSLRGIRANGEEFPIEASISTIEVGSQTFVTLTLRDISERVRAEQAFAESQERLLQSQKMAVIGHLTGGIVHDFNNLLTIIGGHTELLLARLPPHATMRDSLCQIRSANSRAASLTRQLLAFSRKQVVEPKVLDLNTVVKDAEKMIRRLVSEDIELQTMLAPHLNQVKIDPGQMDQVILNLVVNARDAMPKGGRLTIKTFNFAAPTRKFSKTPLGANSGNYVALVVSDTGCGMTSAVSARIFEPFFTTKSVGKGTGLGLTVVQGVIKQSGGYIVVDSEPGIGTAFKIYLPAAQNCLTRVRSAEPEINARGCETILLVEDEDTLRRLGAVVLESYGYNVFTAASGEDALRLVQRRKGKLDLLLTDLVLPGISGCKLAAALQNRRPGMKVLLLSGYTEEDILSRGILNDGSAFLTKPFSPASLLSKIRQVLDGKCENALPTTAGRA